jgi:hypothetical protein
MYGVVSKAIVYLVIDTFGDCNWNVVKRLNHININYFISSEARKDEIPFKLADAVSQEIRIRWTAVYIAFVGWWVLKTIKEKHGGLMKAGRNDLKEFSMNSIIFYNRLLLIYPKLSPTKFSVADSTENSINLHYFSITAKLRNFFRSLIQGTGVLFRTIVAVSSFQTRD